MTQGGKQHRSDAVGEMQPSVFAPLRPLTDGSEDNLDNALDKLSGALGDIDGPLSLSIDLLDGRDTHHWDLRSGAKSQSRKGGEDAPEVRVVMKRETWNRIASGQLNPFDAFANGKLLVGGDLEAAKQIVRHLTDERIAFVSPC